MARIAGADIPREKRVVISLTYIHGIGPSSSQQILTAANVPQATRVRDLTGLDPRVPDESALLVLGLGLPAEKGE